MCGLQDVAGVEVVVVRVAVLGVPSKSRNIKLFKKDKMLGEEQKKENSPKNSKSNNYDLLDFFVGLSMLQFDFKNISGCVRGIKFF